jgi:hypothetical protein
MGCLQATSEAPSIPFTRDSHDEYLDIRPYICSAHVQRKAIIRMCFLTVVQYEGITHEVEGLRTLRTRIQRGFSKVLEATPGVLDGNVATTAKALARSNTFKDLPKSDILPNCESVEPLQQSLIVFAHTRGAGTASVGFYVQ